MKFDMTAKIETFIFAEIKIFFFAQIKMHIIHTAGSQVKKLPKFITRFEFVRPEKCLGKGRVKFSMLAHSQERILRPESKTQTYFNFIALRKSINELFQEQYFGKGD